MSKSEILLEAGTNEFEILEFYIDEINPQSSTPNRIHLGMNVAKVMQAIESPQFKVCDHAPHPAFLGNIPLREHILPVIDLSEWLGIDRKRHDEEVILVTEFSQTVTGFLVSGVTLIHRVGWENVKPPHSFISSVGTSSIIGTVEKDEHLIQLLDMESILSDLNPETMKKAGTSTVIARERYPVFIADDSPTIREMLKRNMDAANLNATFAFDGKEAWDELSKYKEKAIVKGCSITDLVSVLIADIEMPRMDGFTLTKSVKDDAVLSQIPVILYSSIITKELRHKGESVGADEQVTKPEIHLMAERAIRLIEK